MIYIFKNIKIDSVLHVGIRKIFILLFPLLFFFLFAVKTHGQVVINELGISPSSGNTGGGAEFVELYNPAGCSVDISCYVIIYTSSYFGFSTGWTITIPANTILPPCSYYLIGGGGQTKVTGKWENSTGGTNWINVGSNSRDPDLSIKNANSTVLNTTVGLLLDAGGQVSLLNTFGVATTSVAWGTGNNPSSYGSSFTNPALNCTIISPVINPGSASNYNAYNTPSGGRQGLYRNALGNYLVETSLTPGNSNELNNGIGAQLNCTSALSISVQPISQSDCKGNNVDFSVSYSPITTVNYQWQISTDNGIAWSNIVGASGSASASPITYTASNIGVNNTNTNATQYRIIISNAGCSDTSDAAMLTVNEIKGITPQNTQTTICEGGSFTFTATTSGSSPVSYQWLKNSTALADGTVNGVTISGANTATLTVTNASPSETGAYKVRIIFNVIDGSGVSKTCQITSQLIRNVTVNPKPTPTIYHN